MNRRCLRNWLAVSIVIMLMLPWLTVTFIRGDAGMAVCFLLFDIVDPLCAVLAGVSAGKQASAGWPIPLMVSLLFLFGTWLCFDMGETLFVLYAFIYLILGYASMLIQSFLIGRKR